MKKLFITYLLLAECVEPVCSQITSRKFDDSEETWHVGFNTAVTRYCGDLSERYQFKHLQLSWGAEAHVRYRFTYRMSGRADIGLYRLTGDQQYTKNSGNYLSFTSLNASMNIGLQWDLKSVQTDYNIFYLIGFFGVTHLNPNTVYQNKSYELARFQTEGVLYPRWVVQGSYGVGVPFVLSRTVLLRLEGIYTHVFSDYLDDASFRYVDKRAAPQLEQILADRRREYNLSPNEAGAQRGNPDLNDGYFKFSVQLSAKLKTR